MRAMKTQLLRSILNGKNIGAVLLMAPIMAAGWNLTQPPTTPAAAAEEIVAALESGESARIVPFLASEELVALNLTRKQAERIVDEVIAPAYRELTVDSANRRSLPGNKEHYFMAPCGQFGTDAWFVLGVLEPKPRQFETMLTMLYLGLCQAEHRIGIESGTRTQVAQRFSERSRRLRALGMRGTYDWNRKEVFLWRTGSSSKSKG